MKWYDNDVGNLLVSVVMFFITMTMIYLDYDHEQRINALEESCGKICYKNEILWDIEISRREQRGLD